MNVLMPQLGETVAEGTVAKWHKKVGDTVAADDLLFDVETDKVSMEVPSPAAGVITKILVPAGQTVDVGTVLAVIESESRQAAMAARSRPLSGSLRNISPSMVARSAVTSIGDHRIERSGTLARSVTPGTVIVNSPTPPNSPGAR